MAKKKAVDAVSKLLSVLESLEAPERTRVIQAALTLLGSETQVEQFSAGRGTEVAAGRRQITQMGEQAYLDSKDPRTKVEELAVAARYREERESATSSTRADLERVITAARRNFDARNFRRDLENARTKGFFTRGTGRDSIVLSHYGQKYVNALPNREALKSVGKAKGAGRRRGRKKTGRAGQRE